MAVGSIFVLSSGVPASLRREHSWEAGAYVTNGSDLFRVVLPLSQPSRMGMAVLEDCRTLDTGAYTGEQLWHMGLKRVAGRR